MTPEQESVYFGWKRLGWCSLKERTLAVVVLRGDGELAVWAQRDGEPPALKFFDGMPDVRAELQRIGVYKEYPEFSV